MNSQNPLKFIRIPVELQMQHTPFQAMPRDPLPVRGAFIVIEGLDRSGKSTQTIRLLEKIKELKGENAAKLIRFPDRTTTIGKMIDSYLKSHADLDDNAIHLLFSANRWELASQIEADLKLGTILICDRYAYSGIAFSAAKGLSFEWCLSPDIGLPAPDLVLFFDISPEVAQDRGGYGDERYEKKEMQSKVRGVFAKIGREPGQKWVTINAAQTEEAVGKDVWSEVESLVDGVDSGVMKLWTERLAPI